MDLEIMLAHLRAMENFDRHTDRQSVKLAAKPAINLCWTLAMKCCGAPLPEAIRFQLIIAFF
jgi:hypothetical protein